MQKFGKENTEKGDGGERSGGDSWPSSIRDETTSKQGSFERQCFRKPFDGLGSQPRAKPSLPSLPFLLKRGNKRQGLKVKISAVLFYLLCERLQENARTSLRHQDRPWPSILPSSKNLTFLAWELTLMRWLLKISTTKFPIY